MRHKQNNKETKTYVQGLRPFSKTLPREFSKMLKKSGYNYSEIVNKWNILLDSSISKYSYPKSIKTTKDNKGGTLVLAVKRGNEITLEYSKNEIINKINSYFGYNLISKIVLQTVNSERKKIKKINGIGKFSKNFEKKIDKIENEKIRNSLSQLISAIKND